MVCECVCRCVGVGEGVNLHLSRGSLQTPVGVQASRLPGGPAPPGGGAPGGPAPPGGGAAPPPGRPQVTFVVPFQVTILVALSPLPLHSLTLSIHFHRRLRLPSRLHLLLLVRRSPRPLPRKLRRDRCTKRILCTCVRFRTYIRTCKFTHTQQVDDERDEEEEEKPIVKPPPPKRPAGGPGESMSWCEKVSEPVNM